jgi:hypothetical protein
MTATSWFVQLANALTLDASTVDADGNLWTATELAGWFGTTNVRSESGEAAPLGSAFTVGRENGRAMTLVGAAYSTSGKKLGSTQWHLAERRLKAAVANWVASPALLKVTEPGLAAQAMVYRVGNVLIGGNPPFFTMDFQIPLLAMDPRRYSQNLTTNTSLLLTGSNGDVGAAVTITSDMPTGPLVTINGPAGTPFIRNNSLSGSPKVQYNGTLGGGDTLVLDLQNLTAVLNGTTNVRANLSLANWWQLWPGVNNLEYFRSSGSSNSTAQLDYRQAYS